MEKGTGTGICSCTCRDIGTKTGTGTEQAHVIQNLPLSLIQLMEVHIYKANVKQKWCYTTFLQTCTKGRHVPPSNRRWRRKLTGRWWWVHLAQPSPDQSYSTRRDVVTGGIFLMTQQGHVSKILVLNFHLGILLADWLQESDDGNNSREIYPVTTLSCNQLRHTQAQDGWVVG